MISFLKKDTFLLGIILGLLVPVVLYFIIFYVNGFLEDSTGKDFLTQNTTMLISIVLNVFVLRYFLVNKNREKTGRGVLMATFAYSIFFFIVFMKSF
ncbi:MAG: hypothetical protein K9I29_01315 [Bacteroidales bacterium]|nr:hypothetical protein [Bacteroidales bacterium]MCF8326908.1 hypothetical protein [Bacteroidales bacterium]